MSGPKKIKLIDDFDVIEVAQKLREIGVKIIQFDPQAYGDGNQFGPAGKAVYNMKVTKDNAVLD